MWHCLARADVFRTATGYAVAELNCDTPTGLAESISLSELAVPAAGQFDPNARLEQRLMQTIAQLATGLLGQGHLRSVGLVYPTEITEDLALIRFYKRAFERIGYHVVLGAPFNLGERDGTVYLSGEPIALLLRHYKSDWWTERAAAWLDDSVPDTLPLAAQLDCLFRATQAGKLAIVNPFGAVICQNKRIMAFFWEHLQLFSAESQARIRELIPVTYRLESLHPDLLLAQREQWVLKSAYGAEGDQVVLGPSVTDAVWAESLKCARPGVWVAQRYFDVHVDADCMNTNWGVYVAGGQSIGLFARRQHGPTDGRALATPIVVNHPTRSI
jgi:glutathionylspermidine synthase